VIEKAKLEAIKQRGNLPRHIAVIMDGNGRWAKQRGLPRLAGHREGIESVRAVVEACGELGVDVLTLFTFSTENWRRPRSEVSGLMRLLLQTIRKEVDELNEKNVRLKVIGRLDDLPKVARNGVLDSVNRLKSNTGLVVNLALSYSSRWEIVNACVGIARDVQEKRISITDITESLFTKYLHTADIPDPDLLVRTSGEMRISNFLLWQLAYTELYITETLWPDFRKLELFNAIESYQRRERRFGKVSEQLDTS
jgi:undecaprenyl diphosphate synthase